MRLILSPLLIPCMVYMAHIFDSTVLYIVAAITFMMLSLTDFLDGYFARRWGQISVLGALLDPLADKFLLYSTLLVLLVYNQISLLIAMILIGREFFILGLRQIAAEQKIYISVSSWGKCKTFIQSIYLLLCIVPGSMLIEISDHIDIYKHVLMVIVVVFSIGSAVHYYYFFLHELKRMEYEGDF